MPAESAVVIFPETAFVAGYDPVAISVVAWSDSVVAVERAEGSYSALLVAI